MKVFISWSGDLSGAIAEVVRKWLPGVIQCIKPYYTPNDIEKGTRWFDDVSKELEASDFGLLVMTKSNIQSPWMTFEAGALTKKLDKSRICPVLFGIENTDLKGPLVQFQTTRFDKDDFLKLVRSINNSCGEQKLEDAILIEVFDMFWPKLEKEIKQTIAISKDTNPKVIRTERELVEEILTLTRSFAIHNRVVQNFSPVALVNLNQSFRELLNAAKGSDQKELLPLIEKLEPPIIHFTQLYWEDKGVRERPIIEESPK